MSGLSTSARVVHIVLLGGNLGAGLLIVLLLGPDAQMQLQSRQSAAELLALVTAHLDLFFLCVSPIILLSLAFGYFSLGVPLKTRAFVILLVSGLAAIRSQWLSPKMTKLHQAMGRPLEDVLANDPLKSQYSNLEVVAQWLHWAQLGLILFLVVVAVTTSTPKPKFGIKF